MRRRPRSSPASVWRFTQAPLQSVSPLAQASWQAPPLQIWSAAQTVPQSAAVGRGRCWCWCRSSIPRTAPGQAVLGERHWQVLELQTLFGTQAFPQAPQLAPFVGGVDAEPVAGASAGQSAIVFGGVGLTCRRSWRPWHGPRPQAWPQVPQFACVGLEVHALDAAVSGCRGGARADPRRCSSSRRMQVVLQAPQWRASVLEVDAGAAAGDLPAGQLGAGRRAAGTARGDDQRGDPVTTAPSTSRTNAAIGRLPGFTPTLPRQSRPLHVRVETARQGHRPGRGGPAPSCRRPAAARACGGPTSDLARVSRNLASVFCRLEPLRVDFRDGRVPGAKSSKA